MSEWCLEQLYDLIFSGEIGAGAAVREEDLTKKLAVSRSPVRESLRQLEIDGLLHVDPDSGRRRVASFGPADVYELYTIRAGLEEVAAAHAAARMTRAVLDELKALQSAMDQSISPAAPAQRDFEIDIAFHRRVCDASGLPRLTATLSPIWAQTRALVRHLYTVGLYNDPAEDASAYQDHRQIIAALEGHEAGAAAGEVRHHLHARRDQLIVRLKDAAKKEEGTGEQARREVAG